MVEIQQKTVRYAIGLMSGTSCDGIDAALVRLRGWGPDAKIKLIAFNTTPYPTSVRTRLLDPHLKSDDLCLLNVELGELFAEAVIEMQEVARKQDIVVDFVASHGHTIAHIPPRLGVARAGTLQIGEPAVIAERARLTVVSDFRKRDMAAGGQGAPLVPYADWLLFHRDDRTTVSLNLGGIANFTVITPRVEDVVAFDTGPCNMAIDGGMALLTRNNQTYDKDGIHAARGKPLDEFVDYLLEHPFFDRVPPKSTGREEFGPEVYLRDALLSRRTVPMDDIIASITSAVAYSIVRAFNRFVKAHYDVSRLILSGGGAYNKTLVTMLRDGLPSVSIRLSDEYGLSCKAREAVAFALLGNETISGLASNVPNATGASRPVLLGNITPR
jgi:anhydro-N-acetylmuramic acid kinase